MYIYIYIYYQRSPYRQNGSSSPRTGQEGESGHRVNPFHRTKARIRIYCIYIYIHIVPACRVSPELRVAAAHRPKKRRLAGAHRASVRCPGARRTGARSRAAARDAACRRACVHRLRAVRAAPTRPPEEVCIIYTRIHIYIYVYIYIYIYIYTYICIYIYIYI